MVSFTLTKKKKKMSNCRRLTRERTSNRRLSIDNSSMLDLDEYAEGSLDTERNSTSSHSTPGAPTQLDQSNDQSTKTTNTHNSTSSQSTQGAPTNSSQSTTTTNNNGKTPLDEAFEKLGSDLRDITRTYVITESNLFRMAVGSEEEACKKNA